MALQGSLAGMGIAEILQLAGVQQKTGVLHVNHEADGTALDILMVGGRIVGCRSDRPERRELLGQRLLAARAISKEQLAKAIKRSKKGDVLIGEALVEAEAIDKAARDHFVMLQLRERLCGIFEWTRGDYRFENKERGFTRATRPTLSAEAILMDGFRMMDEWPLIRSKIGNLSEVFKILRSPEDGESDAEALERVLDDAFSEFVGDEDDFGEAAGGLGRNERTVFDLVDSKATVQHIVDLSRLGEFEACKALVSLQADGYIGPLNPRRRARRRRGRRQGPLALIGQVLLNLVVLGVIVGAVMLLPSTQIKLDANAAAVASETAQRLHTNRIIAIGMALDVFRFEHGVYPEALEELVQTGLIDVAMLDDTSGLRYISVGTDYDLR
ncbi:MAG: hypothetical protein ACI9U2_000880 [Bradymonadia bacterium]|jgi:hypothetical protein